MARQIAAARRSGDFQWVHDQNKILYTWTREMRAKLDEFLDEMSEAS